MRHRVRGTGHESRLGGRMCHDGFYLGVRFGARRVAELVRPGMVRYQATCARAGSNGIYMTVDAESRPENKSFDSVVLYLETRRLEHGLGQH